MIRIIINFGLLLWVAILTACGDSSPDPAYISEIEAWRQERIEELMAPDGWQALAGLFWLKEGSNAFGAHPDNPVIFPSKVPDTLGIFRLEQDSVYMKISGGAEVMINDQKVEEYNLSGQETAPMVSYGDLRWILIERNGKYGIRLWDHQHPKLANTLHINNYSIDPNWRIRATWVPDSSGHKVSIRNVLDMQMDLETEGRLRFDYQGNSYELTALDGGEASFFMVFADATNGNETYGGGRYLYANRPNEEGITYLDFNKAYNPPCAFTEFATCLLPPAENRLDLAVTAGELNYGEH